jgi:hypothetical protein
MGRRGEKSPFSSGADGEGAGCGANKPHRLCSKWTAFPAGMHMVSTGDQCGKLWQLLAVAVLHLLQEDFHMDFRLLFPLHTSFRGSYSSNSLKGIQVVFQ